MTPPPATGRPLLRSCAPALLRSCAPALLRSCAPALLRSCAPALLRSCDYSANRPVPPCQVPRVTFPSGISQFIHTKAIASGSRPVPTVAGMLTSQPSQPAHSLAPAVFTRIGPLPSAAAPQHPASPCGGGGGSSIFVSGKAALGGVEEQDHYIIPITGLFATFSGVTGGGFLSGGISLLTGALAVIRAEIKSSEARTAKQPAGVCC